MADRTGARDQASQAGNEPASGLAPSDTVTAPPRTRQYLIGSRPLPGVPPVPVEMIVQALNAMAGVEIVRHPRPRTPAPSGLGAVASTSDVVIARMDERQGEALRRMAAPNLVVEPDELLHYADALMPGIPRFDIGRQPIPLPCRGRDVAFRLVGDDDKPVAGAGLFVFGSGFSAQAVTDASGHATATLFDEMNEAPGGLAAVKAVYVRPAANYWERLIPDLGISEGVNLLRVHSLGRTYPNFPATRLVGWGQRMMKLDRLGEGFDGAGVKVALIDAGCDNTHPLLRHVTHGVDLTDPTSPDHWTSDPIGQGTHSAGIIASGGSSRTRGVAGIAPRVELHIFKTFPGGRFSDLISALDLCIERRIDIAAIALASDQGSELVALKLAEARRSGVACLVAAGGPMQFPAIVPGVLAVSAIGKAGEFPPDSYHAQIALGQPAGAEGLFTPKFAAYGPPTAIGGPGLAIVSTVPGGGYAARDGNSTAAAHIVGFAALLLAHHPLLQGTQQNRGEARVAALFETIHASGASYLRGGAEVPLPGWGAMTGLAGCGEPMSGMPGGGFAPTAFVNPALLQLRAMGML